MRNTLAFGLFLYAVVLLGAVNDGHGREPIPREGTEVLIKGYKKIFVNSDCAENNTCDLIQASIEVKDSKIVVMGDWSYFTAMTAEYHTDSPDSLKNYAFVNFARGCVFETQKQTDGSVQKFVDNDVCFPDWTTVSDDSRFAPYRSYGDKKIVHSAFLPIDFLQNTTDESRSINVSFEFRACVYRAKDAILSTPIHCFLWNASHIYSYETDEFEAKEQIDPVCLAKNPS